MTGKPNDGPEQANADKTRAKKTAGAKRVPAV